MDESATVRDATKETFDQGTNPCFMRSIQLEYCSIALGVPSRRQTHAHARTRTHARAHTHTHTHTHTCLTAEQCRSPAA
jgi:hypothetical protein